MKAARGRGVRPGPKLSRQQIDHARKLIEDGKLSLKVSEKKVAPLARAGIGQLAEKMIQSR